MTVIEWRNNQAEWEMRYNSKISKSVQIHTGQVCFMFKLLTQVVFFIAEFSTQISICEFSDFCNQMDSNILLQQPEAPAYDGVWYPHGPNLH